MDEKKKFCLVFKKQYNDDEQWISELIPSFSESNSSSSSSSFSSSSEYISYAPPSIPESSSSQYDDEDDDEITSLTIVAQFEQSYYAKNSSTGEYELASDPSVMGQFMEKNIDIGSFYANNYQIYSVDNKVYITNNFIISGTFIQIIQYSPNPEDSETYESWLTSKSAQFITSGLSIGGTYYTYDIKPVSEEEIEQMPEYSYFTQYKDISIPNDTSLANVLELVTLDQNNELKLINVTKLNKLRGKTFVFQYKATNYYKLPDGTLEFDSMTDHYFFITKKLTFS